MVTYERPKVDSTSVVFAPGDTSFERLVSDATKLVNPVKVRTFLQEFFKTADPNEE